MINEKQERIKILYVEDEELDRMAFERVVNREGLNYECSFTRSVKETTELICTGSDFDVIIADYMLQDGTALDILELVDRIPVIFCTGAGDQEIAVKAMKQGACDYLIKDSAQTYLKVMPEVVKKVVKHKRAEDKLREYYDNLETLVKQRTEELESEKALLSKTLSGMNDGVIAVNTSGEIILINRAAQRLLGFSEERVLGEKLHDLLSFVRETGSGEIECPLERILNSLDNETCHKKCLIETGEHRLPVSATTALMHKADGSMMGAVMVFRDVSGEREIEKMKENFISAVSHELKTPVTSIKAYADIMLGESDLSEKDARRFLSVIMEQTDRLAQLIDRILEISKISAVAFNISTKPVNLCSLVEQVSAELKVLAYKKDINFETELDYNIPVIDSDESRLHSVITNLLNNAVKFTPAKGKVKVTVTRDRDNAVVKVSDTGVGIPKKDLVKIFDRFYRAKNTMDGVQGTGLGLAIVRETVDLLSGRIDVESVPGKGTVFTIYLPLKPQNKKPVQPETTDSQREETGLSYPKKRSNNR